VRTVQFCIISLKPLTQDYERQVGKSVEALQRQGFKKWKALYFV
jgi:hypothetical protein